MMSESPDQVYAAANHELSNPLPDYLMGDMGAVLNWLAGILPQVYISALRTLEIDGRYLAILLTLQQMGAQVQSHLSQRTRIDKATMVSLLNDLELRGCVERRPHPSDKRAYQVHLTTVGEALLAQAGSVTSRATDRLLAPLSLEERSHLHDMLVRVAQRITPATYMLGESLPAE
jgi:DNA-binding MarR family transcriptional regulator